MNLHITESKKFILKFFTSEQRTKSLIMTDDIMPHSLHAIGTWNMKAIRQPRPSLHHVTCDISKIIVSQKVNPVLVHPGFLFKRRSLLSMQI